MFRFNYHDNLLICANASYDLDLLRHWLLIRSPELCLASKIRTIFRTETVVTDIFKENRLLRREVELKGVFVNTYDWDGIFFMARKKGLIQNFINEISRNRIRGAQAATW